MNLVILKQNNIPWKIQVAPVTCVVLFWFIYCSNSKSIYIIRFGWGDRKKITVTYVHIFVNILASHSYRFSWFIFHIDHLQICCVLLLFASSALSTSFMYLALKYVCDSTYVNICNSNAKLASLLEWILLWSQVRVLSLIIL